jgi:hypothetical protein
MLWNRESDGASARKAKRPWFILGFLAAATLPGFPHSSCRTILSSSACSAPWTCPGCVDPAKHESAVGVDDGETRRGQAADIFG